MSGFIFISDGLIMRAIKSKPQIQTKNIWDHHVIDNVRFYLLLQHMSVWVLYAIFVYLCKNNVYAYVDIKVSLKKFKNFSHVVCL